MPTRILPGCKRAACALRSVDGARGYCDQHKAASAGGYDAARGTSSERGYDYDWQRFRTWFLAQPGNALCRRCEASGRIVEAEHVDHIVSLARGGARLDATNCQPLCAPCHSVKTATEDGGFGR